MKHFMETSNTIPDGLGFKHFSTEHIIELLVFAILSITICSLYRRSNNLSRRKLRTAISLLLILDELFKHIMLIIGGNWLPEYLPLHLCSINLFLVAAHAFKPSKAMAGFLYCICLPAALAALLFPNWNKLPILNFMRLHSLSVHMLLSIYPLMLLAGGEIDRKPRQIPKYLAILLGLAGIALCANMMFDTNFMFLMYAPNNNPLKFFETTFGSHLVGFPIIISCMLLIMYFPLPHRKKLAVKS